MVSHRLIRWSGITISVPAWTAAAVLAFLRLATVPQLVVLTAAATTATIAWVISVVVPDSADAWRRGLGTGYEMRGEELLPQATVAELRPARTGALITRRS